MYNMTKFKCLCDNTLMQEYFNVWKNDVIGPMSIPWTQKVEHISPQLH